MFYNTPPWAITTICTCLIKNFIWKPSGKNGSWRKEYITFVNCISHIVSLKTLCEKPSSKNSHREKSTTFNLLGHVLFKIFYSSWIDIDLHDLCINFNILANMTYLIFIILVVLITFKVDSIKLLPLIKPSFEHHCSNHTFYKCVLNNGMHHHNAISFKMVAHNSSMNYKMSKQEQYASYINDYLLVVQNK
jgi:hypothetical protein